jgi:hypothetical protein
MPGFGGSDAPLVDGGVPAAAGWTWPNSAAASFAAASFHGRMGEVRQPDVYPLSQLLLICQQFLQVGQLQAVAPGHERKVVHQVKLLIAEHGRPDVLL